MTPGAPCPAVRLGCVVEHSIGHVTFQANLGAQARHWPDVTPEWHLLPFHADRRWPARRPNWTLRAGLMARAALRRKPRYDVLFFHTQVPALLCPDHLRRAPAILSIDATPAQNARLGIYVGGSQRWPGLRQLTHTMTAATARRAFRIVAWSQWARQSLLDDYGVPPERVEVLPPGIDVALWDAPGQQPPGRGTVRLLFVGARLREKGGEILLSCFRQHWRGRAELHLVTRTPLPPEPGVVVHAGLAPNSPALVHLFRSCDVFVLPTLGDAFAQAVLEAMAGGLPVVASAVGAIPEVVAHGETGFLVPARDAGALAAAVETLIEDPVLRRQMGEAGRERVRQRFDIARNAGRLREIVLEARAAGR